MLDIDAPRPTTHRCPAAGHDHPAAPPCDLVTVPAREGLEAVDILRLRRGLGPVLHDRAGHTLGFLVPPGTAEDWELPGSACTQTYGTGCTSGDQPPVTGTAWLVPPAEADRPAVRAERLRAALVEASRTLAALDRCC